MNINKIDWNQIKLICLDVDGVLTDGQLYYSSNGEAFKVFDVKDGMGIQMLKERYHLAFVSGNNSEIIRARADRLGVLNCILGQSDKLAAVQGLQHELNLSQESTMFVGDDINDLVVLGAVGIFACPSDAHSSVVARADIVLGRPGGRGAIRDLADRIFDGDIRFQKGWRRQNVQ